VLVLLDACGLSWFEERPAWRHDAEVACLKSGAVKQGAGIAELRPIQGPGMCGADFPLRVTMLGEGGPLGFAADPPPPAPIPRVRELPAPAGAGVPATPLSASALPGVEFRRPGGPGGRAAADHARARRADSGAHRALPAVLSRAAGLRRAAPHYSRAALSAG